MIKSIHPKALVNSSLFLKGIFVASLFTLIFFSAISYKHSITVADSSDWVIHTYKVQLKLEQAISTIKEAEAAQRGFILTGDSSFLPPYISAKSKVNLHLLKLKELTKDNLKQQSNLASLAHLIELRFWLLENSLKIYSRDKSDKTRLYNSMLNGKNEMNIIRAHGLRMINLENLILKEHQKKYAHEISFTPLFTLLLLFFSLAVFSFSFYKINTDFEKLKKSNSKLLITTESFKHAEVIGEFSSWQWELDTNKFTYSDNHSQLLACEPQSFESGTFNFIDFVHPSDKQLLNSAKEQLISTGKYPVVFYRVIRQDGQLRYFKSLGKLISDESGKKIVIGINSDVTEEHLNSIALEERNEELLQSNKELASFNHIASHDLQEPLRKIQTFISRISDNESFEFSDKSKEYFVRIQKSAERMRMLIDDLLLFSRTNRIEKIFEKADLNILLENAKQELAQIIEEKTAKIESTVLPELYVIPFQIQQLFVNLIGNSLKYNKPSIAPIIQITGEKLTTAALPTALQSSNKAYYKISIHDNGIGFEPHYAETIFVLFSRLHQNAEYPGTGIGLAICKKIIENHKGFIQASSELGDGATFSFYLPI